MKSFFMLIIVGIFFSVTVSHNIACTNANASPQLSFFIKEAQQCIEREFGSHELKYNVRLKKLFRFWDQLGDSSTSWIDIPEMMALSQAIADDYSTKNPQCAQIIKKCGLVYGVYGLLRMYSSQCIKLLCTIDQSLLYWHEQAHRPAYYFLHKSPLKWFLETNQEGEIKKKTALLQSYKNDFFHALGVSLVHINNCNAQGDYDAVLDWVSEGLELICLTKKNRAIVLNQPDNNLYLINTLYKTINKYVSSVEKKLHNGGLLIPSHFERHWIFYSSVALGVLFSTWYIANHHEKLVNAQKALAIMRSEMYGDLKRPINGFKEAFLQDSHAKKVQVQKIWENLAKERKNFVKRAMNFFPENEYSAEKLEQIRKNLFELKTADITDRYLLKMNGNKITKMWNAPDIGAGIIYEVNGLKLNMLSIINEVYDELFKNVRGNKFTIAVASSVPLYGIFIGLCAGINKIYSMFFYRWFNALTFKATLKKIKDVLIDVRHEHAISPAVYGNLIYLVTVLKQQVHCIAEHQKGDFIYDCDRLASIHMTIEQKIEIVTNMRAYYTHLC